MASKDLVFNLTGVDVNASKTMSETASNAEKATSRIGGAFSQIGGMIGGEFGAVLNDVGEGINRIGESASKMSTQMIIGGGAVTAVGVAMMKMGAADKEASDQLKQAIEASGNSWESYKEDIETTVKSQETFGHSAVDTQDALRKMTTATGDPQKALNNMAVAADLAAAKHISLSDAADLVDRVLSGKGGKALAQFGITMQNTGDKVKDGQVALDALARKLDGQASASMDNFGGFVAQATVKLEDMGAQIGQVAGPILTTLGPAMMAFGVVMDMISKRREAAAAAAALHAAATGAEAVATDGATIATKGLTLAFLTSPIGIIVAGITALVGVIAAVALTSQNATKATQDFTAALQADSGALGENTRAQVAKSLVDSGAIDLAKKLGLSVETVTSAAMGNKEAIKLVDDATTAATSKWNQHTTALQLNSSGQQSLTSQLQYGKNALDLNSASQSTSSAKTLESKSAADKLKTSLESIKTGLDRASAASEVQSQAMGTNAGSAQALANGLGISIDAYNKLKDATDKATGAAKDWKTELDILNGQAIKLDDAQLNVARGFTTMQETIKNNMKTMDAATATSMDISTKTGQANHKLITDQIAAAKQLADAIITDEGDTAVAREKARTSMLNSIQDIKDHAKASGLSSDAVQAIIDKLAKVPPTTNASVKVETADAHAALDSVASKFKALFSSSGAGNVSVPYFLQKRATGGTVYGPGTSTSDDVPMMLSPGEEVINAKAASQWRPLLKQINAGGTPSLPSSGGGATVNIHTFNANPNQSPAEIAANLGWMSRWAI
jgi:hypothetical protein